MGSFRYLRQGFQLMWQPGIRRYTLTPTLINIVTFIAITFFAIQGFQQLTAWFLSFLPDWAQFLSTLLWILFAIVVLFIYAYTFTMIAGIIYAPFSGFIAEAVARHLGQPTPSNHQSIAASAWQSMLREFVKLGYFVPRTLGIFLLSFVPLIQLIVPLIAIFWGGWVMFIQHIDIAADMDGESFSAMRAQVTAKKKRHWGFGLGCFLLMSIPVLNLFTLAAAICGATQLWIEEYRSAAT